MLRCIVWDSKALVATKKYLLGDTIRTLQGNIVPSPTQTSVQLNTNQHVEDEYASWMNHSCLPSCIIYNGKIIATRTILPGIELTFNYTKNETEMAEPFPCFRCNTYINGKKTECPVYKSKYAGHP